MASPTVNGPSSPTGKYFDLVDPEDPEYQRQLRRPATVKEDITQMDNRSRVKQILNSKAFREELEQIIENQLSSGNHPASLLALQQITDLLLPHTRSQSGAALGYSQPVIPINDIRGVDALNYSKHEKQLRCKLASLYRVVDMHGWSQNVYNHITARIDQDHEHFLIQPFGMLYNEVTASSLIKINMQGQVLDNGSTNFGINITGFNLHSAIHAARPDVKCIIHVHTPAAMAVSCMKCGFLPMSQEALLTGSDVSYHPFNGELLDDDEKELIQKNLGPVNKILILQNHGVAVCGKDVWEAFYILYNFMMACEVQIRSIPVGIDNLIIPPDDVIEKTRAQGQVGGGGGVDNSGRKWRVGEIEFEAVMRQLDNAGYRTGYPYRVPLVRNEPKERANSEVEIPPSASSFAYEEDVGRMVSPLKAALERQKQSFKVGWLNSPNTYTKTEIDEIGTDTPKKITKWVADASETGSQPVKVETPNQFAPQGVDPKEFKDKQKLIRKDYYEEKVSAGPQSRILEGISYEEAEKMKDSHKSGTADTVVVVGAASKGIIQRDHQHNATMYKTTYATNPFENVDEADLKSYHQKVEGVTVNESEDLSPGPDGHLISTDERIMNIQQARAESGDAPVVLNGIDTEINEPVTIEVVNGELDTPDMAVSAEHHPKARRHRRSHDRPRESAPVTHTPPTDATVNRAESARYPNRNKELIDELQQKNLSRSHSDRKHPSDKPGSPTKSTDSVSADTLDEPSSKEGSPTKEQAPVDKEKPAKKKKKFRIPSFSKKKKEKEHKEKEHKEKQELKE